MGRSSREAGADQVSTSQKLTTAYIWNLLGKWVLRFIGIGSTLVLVRLLPPEAFGVVATATIYIGLFETLSSVGVNRYLIAHTELTESDLNKAWTFRILIRLAITLLLVFSASYIASFVNEPDVEWVIIAISLAGFLGAFGNIGLVRLEKAVNYKPTVQLGIVVKVITATTTLTVAFLYPTYWALVMGAIVGSVASLIGGYIIYRYSPTLDWHFDKAMLTNSTWLITRAVLGYTKNRLDVFLVSKFFNSYQVGQYKIAQDFSTLPFSEVIAPATWGLFPALSGMKNDKERLFLNTYKFLALTYLLIIPSIVGTFLVAEQFVWVVLGSQWTQVIPILGPLSIMMMAYPLQSVSHNIYDYFGKTKISISIDVVALTVLSLAFGIAAYYKSSLLLTEFAHIRVAVSAFMFLATIVIVKLTLGISLIAMFSILLVPSIGALVMYMGLTQVYMSLENTLFGLLTNIVVGGFFYVIGVVIAMLVFKGRSVIWCFWFEKLLLIFQQFYTKVLTWQKSAG